MVDLSECISRPLIPLVRELLIVVLTKYLTIVGSNPAQLHLLLDIRHRHI